MLRHRLLSALAFFFMLLILTPCGSTIAQQRSPGGRALQERYKRFESAYNEKQSQGYDLSRVDPLVSEGKRAYKAGNMGKAKQLLNEAEAMLNALPGRAPITSEQAETRPSTEYPLDLGYTELGVAFGQTYSGQQFVQNVRDLGIDLTDIYVHWSDLEPRRGQYDWRLLDAFVNQLGGGVNGLVGIKSSSPWGSSVKGIQGGSYPTDADAYRDFIYSAVKRSQGKVKYWMRDWEASSGGPSYWKGTPEEYVRLQKVFYEAVKSADSRAYVVLGGHNGFFSPKGAPSNYEFMDYIFQNGGQYFDLFDIRLYTDPYTILSRVGWFRERMLKFGLRKPIVSTEYGGPMPNQFPEYAALKKKAARSGQSRADIWEDAVKNIETLSPSMQMFLSGASKDLEEKRYRIQARDMVIRTVFAISAGVERLWWWNMTAKPLPGLGLNPSFGKMRLMDEKLATKLPSYHAFARMAAKLDGAKGARQISAEQKDIYLFDVEGRENNHFYVVWERRDLFSGENQPATNYPLRVVAQNVKMTDVFGNQTTKKVVDGKVVLQVSDTPLYVEILD